MPTYQYACTACGHRFEAVQSFSDASLSDCPECAGRLRKVFSSVNPQGCTVTSFKSLHRSRVHQ